jgi:hypothetical protein
MRFLEFSGASLPIEISHPPGEEFQSPYAKGVLHYRNPNYEEEHLPMLIALQKYIGLFFFFFFIWRTCQIPSSSY